MSVGEIIGQSATGRDTLAYYRRMVDRSLRRGDHAYAAEYSCLAYDQAVKIASSNCGMTSPAYNDTTRMAQQLTKLAFSTDAGIDARLRTGFHAARSLDLHLDENVLHEEEIERSLAEVMDAVDLLQTLFERRE